ncbi:MAG: carbamate kinase [Erysipelotrichales bacterium]|nr:carbamate kinase [Erysipelotrichales bacterium]
MSTKRLVIALGGNALGNTSQEQLELVKVTAQTIVDLSQEGYSVIVGHGNGPQVGMINSAMEYSSNEGGNTPYMPFPECGAMSQGYIGYHLTQAIQQELKKRNIDKEVACIITQVVVDRNDPAFLAPNKPIGAFLTKEESVILSREKGFHFMEDAGRGYRRVVPSPQPQRIVEIKAVEHLVESGAIVITVGGGGIPVVETPQGLQGVDAVIDKDRSCAKLALDIKADMLIVLTAVDRVCIHFNTPDQKALPEMSIEQAKRYIKEGHFAPGSMLPKVEACLDFVENTNDGVAMITSLQKAKSALRGEVGTIITR